MTTKPVLVLDLMKSSAWKEEHHPRGKDGKFTTVKGGSKIATKAGKTGVVRKVTATHYLVDYDDGTKSKVKKENVLHANDVKPKGRKKKAPTKKPTATASKKEAPKAKAPAKKAEAKAPAKKANPRKPGKVTTLTGADKPKLVIAPSTPAKVEANKASQEYKDAEKVLPKSSGIDEAWNSKEVQALMSKPPEKRNAKKVQELAGKITNDNDKLAHSLVNRRLSAMGLPQSMNKIGNSTTKNPFIYETGLHGDMLQSARGAMYETLLATLAGTQNPGSEIGAHVVNRMKDKVTKDLYGMLNNIPAPHEIRPAIREMKSAESELMQQLGHTPSDKELGEHLEATSKHFKEAPINVAPKYDERTGQWLASKERIKDPEERLKMLRQYDSIQRTVSADQHVGGAGEGEVTITQNAVDEGRSPEELYERKERQKELEGALPKAMHQMGMSEASVKVWTLTHSGATGNRAQHSGEEVAEMINKEGGWEGKPITRAWVAKHYSAGRKAIEQAIQDKHPALAQLALLKSFVFTEMLKAVYEFNLVKSLMGWGFDHTVLEREFVRTESGRNMLDIKKSLAPTEYIGSVVTVDSGQVHARIVRNVVPKGEELLKAFADFEELNKALFPHRDGGNHAVNSKAKEHIKKNASTYKGMASDQATRIKNKQGKVTWSEQLVLDNPGSAWIRWGGKRILIHSGTGEVLYDSKNEAHREAHNDGAQEDKLEFQHEADDTEEKRQELMKEANEKHKAGDYKVDGKRSATAFADKYGVKMKELEKDGKKEKVYDTDEAGNLQFDHSKHNFITDHGTEAFEAGLSELENHIKNHKAPAVEATHHQLVGGYGKMSDEEKKAFDAMSAEEKGNHLGKHIADREGVRDVLAKAEELAKSGKNGKEIQAELANELKAVGKNVDSMALVNKDRMQAVFNTLGKGGMDEAIAHMGRQELARGREEANKKMLPEGYYEMGNKQTGKSMVVKISHRVDPERNVLASVVEEAFDPKTGKHFTSGDDVGKSWGQLGRELGLPHNSAEAFITKSNKGDQDAVVSSMDENEALELRKKTNMGMRDSMIHKEFAKVDENVGKDGKVISTTYAQDMSDGTQNVIEVGADGYIKDPIMARLIGNRDPIKSADDLHEALQQAVGRTTWVTAHAGSDIHIGDALGHHVKLMYDGKGAPKVVGGQYNGYRFMDSKDVPKGAVDPNTGEPIKTMFKNGKLVDRKFTKQNDLEMKKGNAVMFPAGDGMKRGRIRAEREDGTFEVVDGQGHLVGLFNKRELKPAKAPGRTLADSGSAVVQLKESQAHRMNTSEVFGDNEKAKNVFKQALVKAKVKGAIDKETGELNKELDLSDKDHKALNKVLGRSKAGKEIMKQFNSSKLPSQLELHVPEHLRSEVEAEGVAVGKNGKAIISAGKFEQLRDVLGGLSLDHKAQHYMKDHFRRKDRTPRPIEELKKDYQPSQAEGIHADEFRKQFKPDSFLMNPEQGLYGTQLEGVAHLVERGRGIAGHGMGTGKTILGVMAGLHHKASMKALGQKAGKTLIVAPKGIMSDWGKEIGTHTNSKALYIGSGMKSNQKHPETGRKLWGQAGTEQEATDFKSFKKNTAQHAGEDHDFHIVSYDTFMRNKDHFANSGMYDNIAIDEIHAFKNQGGKRGGSLAEVTDKFKNVWGLSGTPMENDAREVHSLIDTVTGGRHELGSKKEFVDNYMIKDKKGKIVGVKPEEDQPENAKLGDIMANIVQFRGGEDVKYNDGSKIHFPHLSGAEGTADNPNPKQDFIGNMVDRSRDHQTTDYYGTKHSVTDYEKGSKDVATASGDKYSVDTHVPKGVDPNSAMGNMYAKYNELQNQYLPESKLKELQTATATGFDNASGGKGQNYLTAMQKLQKFVNAPLSHKMYVPGGNALDSDATGVQAEKGKKSSEAIPHEVDADGNKRYYESDGKGGYLTNADGSPKLLPPLHHDNPKAQYLHNRLSKYLDQVQAENAERRRTGKPEIMPKAVIKSSYTTFGTDIVDGVLRDLQREHPELQRWASKTKDFGAGRFTGDADDREGTKTGFRGNKKNYAKEQGNLWATTVSPAGKEGVDFGNAHYMVHYDQEWNPQKMAQFTARVRRSDSAKTHAQVDRANAVRVESLHMPGTVEDFMFDAQDKKMQSINQVTTATRNAETAPKLGDTQGSVGQSYRGFTRGKTNKVGAKPKGTVGTKVQAPKAPKPVKPGKSPTKLAPTGTEKALKIVILL